MTLVYTTIAHLSEIIISI